MFLSNIVSRLKFPTAFLILLRCWQPTNSWNRDVSSLFEPQFWWQPWKIFKRHPINRITRYIQLSTPCQLPLWRDIVFSFRPKSSKYYLENLASWHSVPRKWYLFPHGLSAKNSKVNVKSYPARWSIRSPPATKSGSQSSGNFKVLSCTSPSSLGHSVDHSFELT